MSVTRKSALLLTLPVFGLLLWLVLYPNLFVLWRSLVSENRFTLAHYADFFSSPSQMEALGNSLSISLGSVLLSGLIGVPLAFVFHRFDFPGRRIFAALASLPVLLPPLVGVIAFLFLYGESGILTRSLQMLLGLSEPPFSLRGIPAILWVHAYTMYVYFYLFVSAALKRLDESLREASLSLGASRTRTFLRVTLPVLTPAMVGAALLTTSLVLVAGFFVISLSSFELNSDMGRLTALVIALALVADFLLLPPLLMRIDAGAGGTVPAAGDLPDPRG